MTDHDLHYDAEGYLDLDRLADQGDVADDGSAGAGAGSMLDDALAADRAELDGSFEDTWLDHALDAALDPDATYTVELDTDRWWPEAPAGDHDVDAGGGPFDLSEYGSVLDDDPPGGDDADPDHDDPEDFDDAGIFGGAYAPSPDDGSDGLTPFADPTDEGDDGDLADEAAPWDDLDDGTDTLPIEIDHGDLHDFGGSGDDGDDLSDFEL